MKTSPLAAISSIASSSFSYAGLCTAHRSLGRVAFRGFQKHLLTNPLPAHILYSHPGFKLFL